MDAADRFQVIDEAPTLRIIFPRHPRADTLAGLPDLLAPHFAAGEWRYGLIDLNRLEPAGVTALLRRQAAEMANQVAERFGSLVGCEACFAHSTAVRSIFRAYSWLVRPAQHPRNVFPTEERARGFIASVINARRNR